LSHWLDAIQAWVNALPLAGLYALLGAMAFIEGIFPMVPADAVVAFGSFLAARRGAQLWLTAGSIVAGSVAGAMVVYAVARRYGAAWLHARLRKAGIDNLEQRLEVMYSEYGMMALFISRFLPGLRAVCPPMAGATRIPPVRTALVFLLASGIWYGAIAWIAFRVGGDWDQMQASVRHFANRVGSAALILALVATVVALVVVRRRRAAAAAAAAAAAEAAVAAATARESLPPER
jgi:membrane protein DedA with SNARE-associated domain